MNVEIGNEAGNSFYGSICFEFSVLCLCSVKNSSQYFLCARQVHRYLYAPLSVPVCLEVKQWDLAEWLELLTTNAEVATVLPASSDKDRIWGAADEAVMNEVRKKTEFIYWIYFQQQIYCIIHLLLHFIIRFHRWMNQFWSQKSLCVNAPVVTPRQNNMQMIREIKLTLLQGGVMKRSVSLPSPPAAYVPPERKSTHQKPAYNAHPLEVNFSWSFSWKPRTMQPML